MTTMCLNDFIAKAVDVEAQEGRVGLLDYLYETVEDRMLAGETGTVRSWVAGIPVNGLSDTFLVGLLAITLPFHKELPERAQLLALVRDTLETRHGRALCTSLLVGLG